MATLPSCPNHERSPDSRSYCAKPEVVWAYDLGPAQATIARVFMCRSCKQVMFHPTSEYDRYTYRIAIEEAAHKEEAEADRKRRRFTVFFGIRGGASDATRRFA